LFPRRLRRDTFVFASILKIFTQRALERSALSRSCPRGVSISVLPTLSSFHHPTDERSGGEGYCKCSHDGYRKVSLEPLGCVIQELLRGIATLFCCAPYYSYAVLNGIGNRTACARSLVSRFGDVFSRSF